MRTETISILTVEYADGERTIGEFTKAEVAHEWARYYAAQRGSRTSTFVEVRTAYAITKEKVEN